MPKVSICIPTYNRVNYLAYSVASVLRQSYQDFELIICDDGSQDNTAEFVASLNDTRVRYLRHKQNIGRSNNMRSGFEASYGEYFIKFDDDDALTPEFLAKTVEILDNYSEVDFVCTDHWIINAQGEREPAATKANSAKWGKDQIPAGIISNLLEETYRKQSLQVGSTLFRRTCLQKVDYMRPQADGCEDFDLLVRLAMAGSQGYFLPELLMEYRLHGGQSSLKQDIHFLSAKLFCVESYSFADVELENYRQQQIGGLKQILGLRLMEKGETAKARELLKESLSILGNSSKSRIGLAMTYLPISLNRLLITLFRQNRPKTYSEKVRETAG